VTEPSTKSDKRDKVFLPKDFEESRDRAIDKALAAYWKDMQMGPTATLARMFFRAGFIAGQKFEEAEKWRKMIAGINL